MKVVFTDEALRDLDEILTFIASDYPTIRGAFERRLATVLQRIGRWPKSAEEVEQTGRSCRAADPLPIQDILSNDRRRC